MFTAGPVNVADQDFGLYLRKHAFVGDGGDYAYPVGAHPHQPVTDFAPVRITGKRIVYVHAGYQVGGGATRPRRFQQGRAGGELVWPFECLVRESDAFQRLRFRIDQREDGAVALVPVFRIRQKVVPDSGGFGVGHHRDRRLSRLAAGDLGEP